MTLSDRFRTAFRATALAALTVTASTTLAACSTEQEAPDAAPAAEQSSAPVLGDYDDRIQLVEDTPRTLPTDDGGTLSLEITGHDDTESSVVLTVTSDDGQSEETVLEHGDAVELDGVSWRVSEMGFSGSAPGSVTLTREE